MASKPCVIATCPRCRPGRPCAESSRWEADEDYYERVDASHDARRAEHWKKGPHRPPGSYVDPREPWPHDSRGFLLDDPAVDRG